MSPDNVQRFIDAHPAGCAAICPVYFVALWLLISAIISFAGGWFALSNRYRTRDPFFGSEWGMQSGRMRWMTNYNNVLTVGASPEGLYLAVMFLFRFMHPPLLIPWSDITVRRTDGWVFKYITFTMGRELAIPLRVRAKLAERLRSEAGNRWPIEEM